jgi:phosphopantothenoylcysteine decarboxylase/phosphopantothenate--cysteine ligase
MANDRHILVGVTGGIAAYKAAELVRALQREGYDVKVVMTAHATEFIGATTFRALTGHEVALDLFEDATRPIHHISLAQEPDCFVIAPATANVIAKIAQGVADDLLTTTAVAYQGPLVIAPAMNESMLNDETTTTNLALLEARGVRVVTSGSGHLACGTDGAGRLAEVATIVAAVIEELDRPHELLGKRVLITAGPTREPIDAVRFISNRSSGKMGYALAREALARGADVTLISGPTALTPPTEATLVAVQTADEMYQAVHDAIDHTDIFIATAAVADHRPTRAFAGKVKKGSGDEDALRSMTLTENPDILASVGAAKRAGKLAKDPLIVGFAAETEDLAVNARAKLEAKNADFIVANDVGDEEIGFESDENEVTIVSPKGDQTIDAAPKTVIARRIFDVIASAQEAVC